MNQHNFFSQYEDIISLGNNCNPGLSLRELGLKKETYPFDWVRSNPKIIYDVLTNGPERYVEFGRPDANNYDVPGEFEIKHMFACFNNKQRTFPASHINYYGQHFTHYVDVPTDDLKKTLDRYMERFFDRLLNSRSIVFLHTTENYILHKLSRDNNDVYYNYLVKIAKHLETNYPALTFQLVNIEVDNQREDTRHILNYSMNYNLPYSDQCEAHTDEFLIPFRKEVTRILKEILLPQRGIINSNKSWSGSMKEYQPNEERMSESKLLSFTRMGYHIDPDSAVWVTKDYKGFAYSDGDEQEKYIFDAIRTARDVSCSSDELPAKIKDWPSEYHLSPVRSNLMAPFRIKQGTRVLELGCGMGAITRCLGETGAEVIAIEGSMQRAAIARERCRDLNNVQVVCDNFKDFRTDEKFDIVTLIGVMEYSPKYIGGSDPIGACLAIAKNLLKPEGAVIIAIENRLGLKYWNNCAEDHTGGMFDSIHDTYPPSTVATFGYQELKQVLATAGFVSVDFLFPFPDYKLPSVILQEESLGQKEISFASIIGQHFSRDYSGEPYRHFSERLAWHTVEKNGLIPHFSNSFLCVCTLCSDARPLVSEDWLVKIYNSSRSACYRTETTIYRDQAANAIQVNKERIYPDLPMHQGPLTFNQDIEKNYIRGTLLSDEIQKAILRHETLGEFFQKMKEYKDVVISMSTRLKPEIRPGYCPGEFIDCTPFNLIRSGNSTLRYIDNEWITKGDLPLHFVLLRGIVSEITNKISFLDNPFLFRQFVTLKDLVAAVFKEMDLHLLPEDIDYFCRHESAIQAQVAGAPQRVDTMIEHFNAVFSDPLDKALGIVERLAVRDICKMLNDGTIEDNREKAAVVNVDSLLSKRLKKLEPRSRDSRDAFNLPQPLVNRYDILIPIYNAYEHLQRCIDSVLRHTHGNHAIYLLDDCSHDSRVLPLLRSYEEGDARVHVIEGTENRGFIHNVNRGFELSQNDVVILNSDTEVTEGWLDRMDRCRHSHPDIGIVCPLSNNATILSVPVMNKSNSLPEGMDPKSFGCLIAEVSRRAYPEMPTGVGFCMLISRDTLNISGVFDPVFGLGYGEENDLCQRARAAGKKIVCCDDAYVHHYGEASFCTVDGITDRRMENEKLLQQRWPNYIKDVYNFCCYNPLREIQERIYTRVKELEGHGLPSVLHVIHNFDAPGGTELHTHNIIDGLSSRFHSTVIYPSSLPGQWVDIAAREENGYLRVLKLQKEAITVSNSFLGLYGDLINEDVETTFSNFLRGSNHAIVHFQHLIGWDSLLLPLIAKHQGRKVVMSLHDYYLLCPEYNLILPDLSRCRKTMADGNDEQCLYCLGVKRQYHGTDKPSLLQDYLCERKHIIKRVFEAADILIAPSDFVREQFIQAYGDAVKGRIVTIPHGIEPLQKSKHAKQGNILRVGFLGNASDRKGVFVLLQTAQILKIMGVAIQFEIFGGISPSLKKLAMDLGIIQHGYYERKDLPRLLAKTKLVIIPSIWDETFCLTASESQMMGIPVLASDAGAISERIIEGKTGFLVPPNDAKALAAKLVQIQRNPSLLENVFTNLRNYSMKTLAENIEDYAQIYDRLINNTACSHFGEASMPSSPQSYAIPLECGTTDALTSIIILCFNGLQYTRQCLKSLEEFTPEPHEIVIVDNGSTDGTPGFLRLYADGRPNVILIMNEGNKGYAAGNNQAIRMAQGDYVVLLNNDVLVTDGWLGRMIGHIEGPGEVGMVGPVSNSVSGAQFIPQVPYGEDMNRMHTFAREIGKKHAGITETCMRLVGFCLLIRKQVLEIIGGLDEGFGTGNYEDDDLCLRSSIAGYRNIIAQDVFVHHFGSMTFKENSIDYSSTMKENRAYFFEKWKGLVDKYKNDGYNVHIDKYLQVEQLIKWGESAFSEGDIAKALLIFERALHIDPLSTDVLNNVGVIQWEFGDRDAAMETFQTVLRINPDDMDARLNLGDAIAAGWRADMFQPDIKELLVKHPAISPTITQPADTGMMGEEKGYSS